MQCYVRLLVLLHSVFTVYYNSARSKLNEAQFTSALETADSDVEQEKSRARRKKCSSDLADSNSSPQPNLSKLKSRHLQSCDHVGFKRQTSPISHSGTQSLLGLKPPPCVPSDMFTLPTVISSHMPNAIITDSGTLCLPTSRSSAATSAETVVETVPFSLCTSHSSGINHSASAVSVNDNLSSVSPCSILMNQTPRVNGAEVDAGLSGLSFSSRTSCIPAQACATTPVTSAHCYSKVTNVTASNTGSFTKRGKCSVFADGPYQL